MPGGWRPWKRQDSWRLFELGAEVYGWFTNQAAWKASCARLAAQLPLQAGLLVADLGCGPGVSAIELARLRPDVRVVGVDVARRMLDEARRRLRSAGLAQGRVRLVRGNGAELPLRTGSVDVVTGHSFLYLVADRRATLAESLRVLRPGGRLVLMEPNEGAASLRGVLRLSRDPRHLFSVALWRPFSRLHGRFTPASLAATLEAAGFVRCQVTETLGGIGLLAAAEKP